ncbi:MAG: glycosyltransferase family 2 protein [Candidatus Korobacteraceae bacterium]|jgi:glycosyltransferase involved in cell wall biosynthesis
MPIPTLSVITPSYNSAEFLEDALLSVARQQGPRVEHIVIDCASTDNTLEILDRFPQVQWISEPDQGQSDAINKGFLRASGDLVGWLNADDYYLPGGLQAIAHAAEMHPEADVIYGDCVFVDGAGKIVRSKVEHDFDPAILMYFGCYIPSTSTFMRRRVIDSGLLLDCDYRVCMDFEYFARLAHAGGKFHYVPRFIAAFRWHGCNVSLKQVNRRAQERRQVQRTFGERQYSSSTLKLLADVHRIKRVWRKIASGNIARELRVRELLGRDTRWQCGAEGSETCASLACL